VAGWDAVSAGAGAPGHGLGGERTLLVLGGALAIGLPLAALSSRAEDWQPVSLVLALGALMVLAEAATIGARNVRVSSGLTVQVTIMALLGPAPAVAFAVVALLIEAVVNRVRWAAALANTAIFAWLGLVGGVLFGLLGDAFELDRDDTAYAVLVLPIYCVVAGLDIVLVAATNPALSRTERLHLFRESALPTIPWELVSCVIAGAAVLVWAHAGLAAAAVLLGLLLVTTPLLRALESAIKSGDDRARLLSEVLHAEERERARLAESLHEGPMQRLLAMRQDMREDGAAPAPLVEGLDAAIAEARAIVSALHPASVRELGFEGALRAAVAPFVALRPIELTMHSDVEDRVLTGTLLLPIAQELVVNAVKHAEPTRVAVCVARVPGAIVLEVSDDGVGIDTTRSGRAVQAGHVGLAVVRRRVEDAGGRFEIATRADGGTRSRVSVPELSR
jgi:signal transduction histidine kinase